MIAFFFLILRLRIPRLSYPELSPPRVAPRLILIGRAAAAAASAHLGAAPRGARVEVAPDVSEFAFAGADAASAPCVETGAAIAVDASGGAERNGEGSPPRVRVAVDPAGAGAGSAHVRPLPVRASPPLGSRAPGGARANTRGTPIVSARVNGAAAEREREREGGREGERSFIDNLKVKVGKYNALSGDTAPGRRGHWPSSWR
jgi:hypothetical protein